MKRQKVEEKQCHGVRGFYKIKLMSVLGEFAFLITGSLLAISAYLFLHVFVERMIRSEYSGVLESTVESVVARFDSLQSSLDGVAVSLAITGTDANKLSRESFKESARLFHSFEQVVILYQQEGRWNLTEVYAAAHHNGQALLPFRFNKTDEAIARVTGQNGIANPPIRFFSDSYLFAAVEPGSENINATPFLLAAPLDKSDPGKGIIVGISQGGMLLDQAWRSKHMYIAELRIRESKSGADFFHFKKAGDELWDEEGKEEFFKFEFAGKPLEISMKFFQEQKAGLLKELPFFMLIFGFILTAAGTLYIHTNYTHSLRVSHVNSVLEDKNRALREEMGKRESLHEFLLKAERENKAVIDSVSDIIFETDMRGRIVFLNATWQKITGFEIEQYRGQDLFNMLHPQDQERQRKDFQALVSGQKKNYRSFTRLRTQDGSFRAVELSISMIRQDESGKLRAVGAITDVEERRRVERALGEAEKKYRAIVENAASGIYQLTPEGVYLSANPALARILGYGDSEDLLRHVKNANESVYFNARERQYFLKELERAGTISNYETQVMRKDGSRIWVNENVRLVKDGDGSALYYEGSIEDISQRKQAEIALREAKVHSDLANRAKSEFLANMSHELRTPLNSIIGFSEIIKNEVFGPLGQDAYKEYARDIHESGRRLLNVITEILDISRIEAGARHLNEQIVDIMVAAESSLKLLEFKAKSNQLIVTNLLKDVPQIVGEELAVKQILVNLLSNSIKFTPPGGRITISNDLSPEGDLRISITDTGIGLDDSEIEKALSPFGQLDNALKRHNTGTGLGLTLVDALVKLHGGRMEILSHKGIGTTVVVILPADRVAPQVQQAKKPTPESA